jgi:hypothetical protein
MDINALNVIFLYHGIIIMRILNILKNITIVQTVELR